MGNLFVYLCVWASICTLARPRNIQNDVSRAFEVECRKTVIHRDIEPSKQLLFLGSILNASTPIHASLRLPSRVITCRHDFGHVITT